MHAAVSEKPELTDDGRTDTCAITVGLLTKSSRLQNYKKSKFKIVKFFNNFGRDPVYEYA